MNVFMTIVCGLTVVTLQNLSHSLFLRQFHWTLWIHFLHFGKFIGSNGGKMPDEVNKMPTLRVRRIGRFNLLFTERRHSRKADPIFDDVVEFAIR